MSSLYIITAPVGVEKSTISKKITESKKKFALIESDEIYHQVVGKYVQAWREENHLDIFLKICLSSIKTCLENRYDVFFNYIVNSKNVEVIKNKFKNYTITFVILVVDEKILLLRDNEKTEDYQMKERCIILLNSFKNKKCDIKNILNTTTYLLKRPLILLKIPINLFYRRS